MKDTFLTLNSRFALDFCLTGEYRAGISCPNIGQVVGQQQSYSIPYNNCLFVAGEHTSPAWFGFMEGALE
jgi:monoamine oxidase